MGEYYPSKTHVFSDEAGVNSFFKKKMPTLKNRA